MGPPDFLAGGLVQRHQGTAHAVLTARETGDNQVFYHGRWRCNDGALRVVNDFRLPQLLARLGIKRHHMGIKAANENLAIGIRYAAVDNVAAGELLDALGNLWLVSPLDFAGLGIHRKRGFRSERRCDKQGVADQNRG